jgi:diaminopimelate epimerase
MQGLGNDFIVVDDRDKALNDAGLPALSRRLNDRHFGIGADGLILVRPSASADFQMRVINSDGSEAEMCGNGIRCFAVYLIEKGLTTANPIRVETPAGVMVLDVRRDDAGRVSGVRVDMGEPSVERADVPMEGAGSALDVPISVDGMDFIAHGVNMGNPHAVIFLQTLDGLPLERLGPRIETHPLFPAKTNVHFVEQVAPNELRMRIWERGAGMTLACGTGACAVLVAAHLTGKTGRSATIHLPGGPLEIEWAENNHLFMTGPAEEVFTGQIAV